MFAANRNFHTFVARLIKKAVFKGDVAHPDSLSGGRTKSKW